LPVQQSIDFGVSDIINISVNVTVDETASKDDTCEIMFSGQRAGGTYQLNAVYFDIEIDELVLFELVTPSQTIDLVPGTAESFDIRLYNNGSDTAVFYLDFIDVSGLSNTVVSSTSSTTQLRQLSIEAGTFGIWGISIEADVTLAGLVQQSYEVTYGGQTVQTHVTLDVAEVPMFTMEGPDDQRILVTPGSNASTSFEVENTGSKNLSLSSSISGLPTGVTASFSFGSGSLDVTAGTSSAFVLDVRASASAYPGTYSIDIMLMDGSASETITIDLIIEQRYDVEISSLESSVSPSPLYTTNMTLEVTNIGTSTDTYLIELDTSESSGYYSTTLSRTTVTVSPASTQLVVLGIREGNNGAPSSSLTLTITATSTTDYTSTDSATITIVPLSVSSEVTIFKDNDVVAPGGAIYGNVILTNTGSSLDSLYITTVGLSCGIGSTLELGPGSSSAPILWRCDVPESSSAGAHQLTFRVSSAARSNIVMEQSVVYTVLPTWSSQHAISIETDVNELSMAFEGGASFIVRLTNDANAEATGNIELFGNGEANFEVSWLQIQGSVATNEFTLAQGESVDFKVTLHSLLRNSATAELNLRVTSEISNIVVQDEYSSIFVTVEGPDLAPTGLSLPLGFEVTQSQTIGFASLGWLAAVVFFMLLRRRKDSTPALIEEDEIEEVKETKEEVLGFNECRIDDDNKVRCPSCETKLGVPRNSTPPFKFTCPKCDSMIRVVGPPSQKF
jgi:hypothetical protein